MHPYTVVLGAQLSAVAAGSLAAAALAANMALQLLPLALRSPASAANSASHVALASAGGRWEEADQPLGSSPPPSCCPPAVSLNRLTAVSFVVVVAEVLLWVVALTDAGPVVVENGGVVALADPAVRLAAAAGGGAGAVQLVLPGLPSVGAVVLPLHTLHRFSPTSSEYVFPRQGLQPTDEEKSPAAA